MGHTLARTEKQPERKKRMTLVEYHLYRSHPLHGRMEIRSCYGFEQRHDAKPPIRTVRVFK
jgi:hypothetical protein